MRLLTLYISAVMLLGWWPWNLVLILAGIAHAKLTPGVNGISVHFPSVLFDTHLSRRSDRIAFVAFFALAATSSIALIVLNWASGHSVSNALAGFLPFTDAQDYYTCANSLIDFGRLPASDLEWCSRRPLYSSLLSFYLSLGGRNLHAALLIQAIISSLAIAILAREIVKLAGIAGALLAVAILCRFAAMEANGATLSENAGLPFGAVGLALLLYAAETGRRAPLFFGVATLSIALNARAGCFFVLPMLVVWSGLDAYFRGKSISKTIAVSTAAIVIGFAPSIFLNLLNGAPLSQAHGNLAPTLYGLSVGGKGWLQVYTDHPELANLAETTVNRQVYSYAMDNVLQAPFLFVKAILANIFSGWNAAISLQTSGKLHHQALWYLWATGLTASVIRFRDSRFSLLALFGLGSLLSCSIIIQDGGLRVFAATIGGEVTLAALGLAVFFQRPEKDGQRIVSNLPRSTIVLAVFLTVAPFLVYTPLRWLSAQGPIDSLPCPDGATTLVTHVGVGADALLITAGNDAQISPPRAGLQRLVQSMPSTKEGLNWPVPYSILLGFQLWNKAADAGSNYPVVWSGDFTSLYGRRIKVCFVKASQPSNGLWSTYYKAQSVELLGPTQ